MHKSQTEDEIVTSLSQLAAGQTVSGEGSGPVNASDVETNPTKDQSSEKVNTETKDSVSSQPKEVKSSASVIQNLINEALSVSNIKVGINYDL